MTQLFSQKDYNIKIKEKSSSLILLTYKGKILLMHKKIGVMDEQLHPWVLIEGIRQRKESAEEALARAVKTETGIKIENIQYVSEFKYHAVLTDDNINNMRRAENQLLDFFTVKDLQKLLLSKSAREFVTEYGYLAQTSSVL